MDGQESGLKVIQESISPVPNRVIQKARCFEGAESCPSSSGGDLSARQTQSGLRKAQHSAGPVAANCFVFQFVTQPNLFCYRGLVDLHKGCFSTATLCAVTPSELMPGGPHLWSLPLAASIILIQFISHTSRRGGLRVTTRSPGLLSFILPVGSEG